MLGVNVSFGVVCLVSLELGRRWEEVVCFVDTFSCFVSSILSGCHDSITVATVGELCYVMYM